MQLVRAQAMEVETILETRVEKVVEMVVEMVTAAGNIGVRWRPCPAPPSSFEPAEPPSEPLVLVFAPQFASAQPRWETPAWE